ncbi:MAG: hydrogenase 3 maturation protease [Methanoregulaceae archaeon PtaU1.Bin222]|nr:MAG: hydrogenase 3 maturation protease [Methanoregulaceae archaeon PtaU1.Bin222]
MVNLLFGVGNTLRKDDGAGNYVASRFRNEGWKVFDCGTAPENFSGVVKREHPEILVIVDAADMGLAPGEFMIVPKEKIRDVGIGTHQLPLDTFIDFLGDAVNVILIIGIQPTVVTTGEGLTPAVQEGTDRLIRILESGKVGSIPVFCGES